MVLYCFGLLLASTQGETERPPRLTGAVLDCFQAGFHSPPKKVARSVIPSSSVCCMTSSKFFDGQIQRIISELTATRLENQNLCSRYAAACELLYQEKGGNLSEVEKAALVRSRNCAARAINELEREIICLRAQLAALRYNQGRHSPQEGCCG